MARGRRKNPQSKQAWRVYCFRKKKNFEVEFEGDQRGFLLERKGKIIPRRGAEDGKDTVANSGRSDRKKLEAKSIRARTENIHKHTDVHTHIHMAHTYT